MTDDIRIPPQNIEAERAVLASILLENRIIKKVGLTGEDFYKTAHKLIFNAMLELSDSEIDSITLTETLEKNNNLSKIGGASYLSTLYEATPTSAGWQNWALIVKEKADRRLSLALCHQIESEARSGSLDAIFGLIQDYQKARSCAGEGFITAKDMAKLTFEYYEKVHNKPNHIIGVGTGLTKIDESTGGFLAGNLIIIGGRPGAGKSAFAFNVVEHIAKEGKKAGIFSIEMQPVEVGIRHLSSITNMDSKRIRLGKLNMQEYRELLKGVGEMTGFPHLYCFDSRLTLDKFRRYSEEMVEQGAEIIMADYLQLFDNKRKGGNREEAVSEISRTSKQMAGELKVPVILLAQINRQCQIDRRYPNMHDLRESGAIEQDADLVILLHSDTVYQVGKELDPPHISRAIIAKGRHVEKGMILLGWNAPTTKFYDLTFEQEEGIFDE